MKEFKADCQRGQCKSLVKMVTFDNEENTVCLDCGTVHDG